MTSAASLITANDPAPDRAPSASGAFVTSSPIRAISSDLPTDAAAFN
jgi:hypothetical protein